MPAYTYPLEHGGPKLVEVSWKGFYKNMIVRYDNEELGTISGRAELKQGRCFTLPTGGQLCLRLVSSFMASELHVLHNGKPLPGSGSDPWQQLKVCAGSLYFFAAVSFLFGALSAIGNTEALGGYISMGVGILFAVLAWLVSKAFMAALITSIALVTLNALLLVALPLLNNQAPRYGWFIFYMLMIIPLFRGFAAIREVQASEQEKPFDQV